jgi:hypothetical protein
MERINGLRAERYITATLINLFLAILVLSVLNVKDVLWPLLVVWDNVTAGRNSISWSILSIK